MINNNRINKKGNKMNKWFLSIHPQWVELIKSGKKTMELRKRLPKDFKVGDLIYVYTTLPVGRVELILKVQHFENYGYRDSLMVEHKHCVSSKELYEYTKDGDEDNLWGIDFTIEANDLYIPLSALRGANIMPPKGIVKGDVIEDFVRCESLRKYNNTRLLFNL